MSPDLASKHTADPKIIDGIPLISHFLARLIVFRMRRYLRALGSTTFGAIFNVLGEQKSLPFPDEEESWLGPGDSQRFCASLKRAPPLESRLGVQSREERGASSVHRRPHKSVYLNHYHRRADTIIIIIFSCSNNELSTRRTS